jgi:hypothetical protein
MMMSLPMIFSLRLSATAFHCSKAIWSVAAKRHDIGGASPDCQFSHDLPEIGLHFRVRHEIEEIPPHYAVVEQVRRALLTGENILLRCTYGVNRAVEMGEIADPIKGIQMDGGQRDLSEFGRDFRI